MFKKTTLIILILISSFLFTGFIKAEANVGGYTTLTRVDLGTFNEYRYKITEQYFALREIFDIDGVLDIQTLQNIEQIAKEGYNYLPDNLVNQNYLNSLTTEIKKGIKYPHNESNYTSIVKAIQTYIENVQIDQVKGFVEAFPQEGNAPLTVTLRGRVTDPTGTKIPDTNYTWWIDEGGKRNVIGNKPSISYVFKEEGSFSVFLDVKSNHRNSAGYTDVLSFRSRADITVKEKIASLIIKVNSSKLGQRDELKFTPEEASYGLLFDATSSTPTAGTKFTETSWDFGNGVEKTYSGEPNVERVKYTKEGRFNVKLKLRTNEGKTVERKFVIDIHDPIATIVSVKKDGYLGDKFTFSTKTDANSDELTYSWEIVDTDNDEVVLKKTGSILTYVFNKKGRYSIKLKATDINGESDIDTKVVFINSRPPFANFTHKISAPNTPNTVFLDATESFDPDFTDEGKLKFDWIINGNRIELDNPNYNGSIGYYTFDSIGEHSVVLEVTDPDRIISQKKEKVRVDSILSVDFTANPRVITREGRVSFDSISPEAMFYEWDFGDGETTGGEREKTSHVYEESGIFDVTLTVRDQKDNKNSVKKVVYVGESNSPYAFIDVSTSEREDAPYKRGVCSGNDAYIVDKVSTITFSGKESVNITGKTSGLTYSWKIGKGKYFSSVDVSHRFDELGCFPVKLTVKSKNNNKTHSVTKWIKVENVLPTISSIDVEVINIDTDPVVVNVRALGAKDKDGVIQSYLWYYYTDIDSEPQDFRSTMGPSTTFVLPKVTGNYYFVVVMKDNNEARISSEEISESKYFITLTGDNINTPLITLNVSDSALSVGEEFSLNAGVKNILGQNIAKNAKYSWDFDGDGFYDKETTTSDITHKYNYSGEYHAKVKVKYKGFSNTKSITLNVANKLVPDFEYISVGNKYIFLNTSKGKIDSSIWYMGDDTTVKEDNSFMYSYKDGKKVHDVKLKIIEGTKTKEVEKKVISNIKNILKARKPGAKLFSYPEINSDAQIVLEDISKVFVYPGESKGDFAYYAIDYDIDYDSDLNGGKDDDEDNKDTSSYTEGNPVEIKLNKNKVQKLRLILKDEKYDIVDSYDFEIVKNYITEEEIDMGSITFEGVTDSEKVKIEKLKVIISNIPGEHRLKAMMYLQKLQEEWFDYTEKTRVIIEFESYIDSIGVDTADTMIEILESLLVEGEDDQSEKNVSFNALKNLIPEDTSCEYNTEDFISCKDYLVSELERIRDGYSIEENNLIKDSIGNVLLQNAKEKGTTWMSVKELKDFKAIIDTLVYGGVDNIPEEDKQQVINDVEDIEDTQEGSSILQKIGTMLFMIILIVSGIVIVYWIYFKVSNKKKGTSFEDFITEKTSDETEPSGDILGDISKEEAPSEEVKVEDKQENKVDEGFPDEETTKIEEAKVEDKIEEPKVDEKAVPDWLKTNFDNSKTEELKIEETKTEELPVEEIKQEETKVEESKSEEIIKEEPRETTKEELDEITKIEDNNVPDWLKGSFGAVKEEVKTEEEPKETTKEVSKEKPEEIKKDISKGEEKSDDNIPDWLKGSFEETKPQKEKVEKSEETPKVEEKKEEVKTISKEDKKEEKIEEVKTEEPKEEKTEQPKSTKSRRRKRRPKKTTEDKKEEPKKEAQKPKTEKVTKKKEEIVKEEEKPKTKKVLDKKEEPKEKKEENKKDSLGDVLWDDGMKVPDWLKTDEDKK